MRPNRSMLITALVAITALGAAPALSEASDWTEQLGKDIKAIDDEFEGSLGVYVKHLGDGRDIRHRIDRDWYFASTIKIPLAIAVMQLAEAGQLSLDEELTLKKSDYVDGSGALLWVNPGARYTLAELIGHSTENSDSTATDMLIRAIGEERFNHRIREHMAAEGFGPITTIVQVRRDAYAEIHPNARNLTNLDFIDLRTADSHEQRFTALLDKLGIDREQARADSIREAFERYYRRGLNAGRLDSMGRLLERLVRGELLDEDNTEKLLDHMIQVTTGDDRIKAGLPADTVFAHKTGTQVARACNVGVIHPRSKTNAVVVAACAEDFDRIADAEQAFASLGRAIHRAGLARKSHRCVSASARGHTPTRHALPGPSCNPSTGTGFAQNRQTSHQPKRPKNQPPT